MTRAPDSAAPDGAHYRVRVSATIISDLEGSQAWHEVNNPDSREHPADLSLVRKVRETRTRKDGSVTVSLDAAEVEALYLRADWLMDKSRDSIGDDPSALGDYNAGAALARQIEKVRGA